MNANELITDLRVWITVNPNTYSVSYILFDDDGITLESSLKPLVYMVDHISDISRDLLNKFKPKQYKIFVNGKLASQRRD